MMVLPCQQYRPDRACGWQRYHASAIRRCFRAYPTGSAQAQHFQRHLVGLEARGLDITPSLIRQISETGDTKTAEIFHIIYEDEKGHVAVGAKWFRYLCHKQGREPAAAFQQLVRSYFRGPLKPPFNDLARARSGITPGFYRALSPAGN